MKTCVIGPFFQFLTGAFKFVGEELFVWKDSLILGGEHLVGEIVECVVGLVLLPFRRIESVRRRFPGFIQCSLA